MSRGGKVGALRERLDEGLTLLGLSLDSVQRDRLIAFLQLLHRWNRTYNLTAVRDPWEMVPRHLLDSLSISPYLLGGSIMDAGTGAGLPGLPLAIVAPERTFLLLDSNGKKTRFVRQAVLELGLSNVIVVQDRLESYRTRRKFATIVSRAVSTLSELLAATEGLFASPSRLLVMKGRYPETEFQGLKQRCDSLTVHRLEVPFVAGERHLIEFRID